MGLVSMKEVLVQAQAEKYAVPAFNVCNLEYIQTVINTAAESRSPVIISAHPVEIEYAGLDELTYLVKRAADRVDIPVVLHLDHGDSLQRAVECIRAGFTSVMFDGSTLDFEENILRSAQIAEVAHSVGVSVEAELGLVGGAEEGKYVHSEGLNEQELTDPTVAAEFVSRTGVDSLAVAIGTAHGLYTGVPKIDVERLKQIRANVSIPLVLHGGSGTPDEIVSECVRCGISKINIASELKLAFHRGIIEFSKAHPENFEPREVLVSGKVYARQLILNKFSLFGSLGKAK